MVTPFWTCWTVIDGAATFALATQYKSVTVQSDDVSNWWKIAVV
jgi:hypothetical protein